MHQPAPSLPWKQFQNSFDEVDRCLFRYYADAFSSARSARSVSLVPPTSVSFSGSQICSRRYRRLRWPFTKSDENEEIIISCMSGSSKQRCYQHVLMGVYERE